jgi:hypothetical protein
MRWPWVNRSALSSQETVDVRHRISRPFNRCRAGRYRAGRGALEVNGWVVRGPLVSTGAGTLFDACCIRRCHRNRSHVDHGDPLVLGPVRFVHESGQVVEVAGQQ